jgi:hypothetical protein
MLQFTAPWFAIAGLLAATAPILIHLLNRRRYRTLPWAAIDFLRQAIQRSRRVLQLRDLILLALRIACLALVGLALARPYLLVADNAAVFRTLALAVAVLAFFGCALWAMVARQRLKRWLAGAGCAATLLVACWGIVRLLQDQAAGRAASARQPLHAIVILDNSLSMGYTALHTSLLQEAIQRIDRFLGELPPGSQISILPLCGPRSEFSTEPFRTRDDARQALRAIRLVDRPGHVAMAAGLALEALQKAPELRAKRIVFIGDQQASNWRGALAALTALPELQVVQVAPPSIENAYVADVRLRDGLADVETPSVVMATISYRGPQPRTGAQVTLEVDGAQVASRTIDLQPGQTQEIEFTHTFEAGVEPGRPAFAHVKVALPPDRLAIDDVRHLQAPVVAALPVVFVDQHSEQDEDPARDRYGETFQIRQLLAPVTTRGQNTAQLIQVRHTTLDQLVKSAPGGEEPSDLVALEDVRLVIIAGVDRPDPGRVKLLREYVLQGGQLILAAGAHFDAQAWHDIAWRGGEGILPLPLRGNVVGQTPSEATSQLEPFFLDFASLEHNSYFRLENEHRDALQDLYSQPLFFKVVPVDDRPDTLCQLLAAESARLTQAAALRRRIEALARNPSDDQRTAQEKAADEALLDEILPDWLLWRLEAEAPELNPAEQAARSEPRIHARFTNGLPFLVERRVGQGRVMFISSGLFSGPAGSGWNTLPRTDAIVLVDRIVRRMIEGTLPSRNFEPLDAIELGIPVEQRRLRHTLGRPRGGEEPLPVETLGNGRYGVVVRQAVDRGAYVISTRAPESAQFEAPQGQVIQAKLGQTILAVNGPAEESDLALLDEAQFNKLLASAEGNLSSKVRWVPAGGLIQLEGAQTSGQDFWWRVLLLGALAMLLTEMGVLCWPALSPRGTA